VGNPALRLKNFVTALEVLRRAHASLCDDDDILREEGASDGVGPYVPSPAGLAVTWVCQMRPAGPEIESLPFAVEFVVDPPQGDIPAIYRRGYDALLFTSAYEAWGMPVLEAMASGVPVVSSKCHGVDMFCSHRYNCLLAPPFDAGELARCLSALLTRPRLGETFARRARVVAQRLTWDASLHALESAL